MMPWIQVCLGGAAGALLRYLISGAILSPRDGAFPWGVFTVNVTGCLLIGLLAVWMDAHPAWKPLVFVGLLGGFTTFSSFGYETVQLIQNKAWINAVFYVLGTNLAGITAVLIGLKLARIL